MVVQFLRINKKQILLLFKQNIMLRTNSNVFSYLIVFISHISIINIRCTIGWSINSSQNIAFKKNRLLIKFSLINIIKKYRILHCGTFTGPIMTKQRSDLSFKKIQRQIFYNCLLFKFSRHFFYSNAYRQMIRFLLNKFFFIF